MPAIARTRKYYYPTGARALAILQQDGGMTVACAAKALFVSENFVRSWRQDLSARHGFDLDGGLFAAR